MKKILIALMMMSLSTGAIAETIDLKGLEIGISKKEAKKVWKDIRVRESLLYSPIIPVYFTTLAGKKLDKPWIKYDNDKKVNRVIFRVYYNENQTECDGCGYYIQSPQAFDEIVTAIKGKYSLTCENEDIKHSSSGIKVENEYCELTNGDTRLITERYWDGANFGRIELIGLNIKVAKGDL
jgi:hypothetical protein|tara:strand:- start:45 stop:587 length:543 start_codon:yes stop_codon:yes gene_type:complete